MIDFDMMLVNVGEFGIYQKILFLFQAPFAIFVTFTLFGQLFIYLYPRVFWCTEGPCVNAAMLTPQQRRNLTVPWILQSRDYDYCLRYNTRPQEVLDVVNRAQEACQRQIDNGQDRRIDKGKERQRDKSQNAGQSQPLDCDYEVDGERAFITRRPPRSPQSGYGYGAYGGGQGSYYDTYTTTTEQYKYTRAPTVPPYAPERKDWKTGNENTGNPELGSGQKPPNARTTTKPRANSNSGNTQGHMASRNESVCTETVVNLVLGQNFSVNAESLANQTIKARRDSRLVSGWTQTVPCTNWSRQMPLADPPYETVVTQEGWYCNADQWINTANAVFYLGAIVGGIGIGYIADSRGRVPALVTANALGCIGGALSAFYWNFYVFLFLRFIAGMAFDNCFTMIYILVLEYVGPTYRTLVANLSIAIFYTMGTLMLPGLALLIRNWQIYMLVISLPMSLALAAIFIVPESARWLLSKGRTKEATQILRSFAKVNRKHVDEKVFVEFEEGANKLFQEFSTEKEPSLWEAFKKPRIAKNFFFLTVMWALIALVYDGHSRNILNLGDDVFLSFTIASSTEFPADMLLIFTLDRFGRRWLAFGSMCLSGAFSLGSAFVPQGMATASLVTALISRFFVNVAFNIGLQYAAELLPTVIRAQGVNVIHIMGYVASIVSPFIASIGRTNPALSLSLLGIIACTCGVLCLFLPETLGEELPNTLEEGQEFGKNQSFWNCPICAKPRLEEDLLAEEVAPTPVQLRNNLRASLRGEAFRSSIISTSSSRRVTPSDHLLMDPSGQQPRLRRGYTH